MCDLRHADIGIGQQRLGGFDVVIGEFWRAASGAAKPTGGGKARLGAFSDQTALEFRKRAKHVKNQPPLKDREQCRPGAGCSRSTDCHPPAVRLGLADRMVRMACRESCS